MRKLLSIYATGFVRTTARGIMKRCFGRSEDLSCLGIKIMPELSSQEITLLLRDWNLGDEEALPKLVPLIYNELHRMAHFYMRGERVEHTLQTTALINEAYLRLSNLNQMNWQDRNHFFAVSARLMRRILVDSARARKAGKRGGEVDHIPINEDLVALKERDLDLIALDLALKTLSELDERKSKVVELRFFGGLGVRQTAEILQISVATAMRDWDFAKAWIFSELKTSKEGT
jgi:RNA polymerase sigma factor (TIGR02999 family)